jgi:hypothetical protein
MSNATFNIKKALFTSKLDLNFRKKLVSAIFGPQLSMVLKPGHFRKQIQNTWEVLKTWCCRRMEKISWANCVRKEEVL